LSTSYIGDSKWFVPAVVIDGIRLFRRARRVGQGRCFSCGLRHCLDETDKERLPIRKPALRQRSPAGGHGQGSRRDLSAKLTRKSACPITPRLDAPGNGPSRRPGCGSCPSDAVRAIGLFAGRRPMLPKMTRALGTKRTYRWGSKRVVTRGCWFAGGPSGTEEKIYKESTRKVFKDFECAPDAIPDIFCFAAEAIVSNAMTSQGTRHEFQ